MKVVRQPCVNGQWEPRSDPIVSRRRHEAWRGGEVIRFDGSRRPQPALLILDVWLTLIVVQGWLLSHVTPAPLILVLAALIAFALTSINLLALGGACDCHCDFLAGGFRRPLRSAERRGRDHRDGALQLCWPLAPASARRKVCSPRCSASCGRSGSPPTGSRRSSAGGLRTAAGTSGRTAAGP
jgi:hypothetical protein